MTAPADVLVYTTTYCPYCVRAKALLDKKGASYTEVACTERPEVRDWLVEASMMSADRCAKIGLRALFGGRRNIISGWSNSLMCWSLRFVPRRIATWIAGRIMGKREA